MKVLFIVLSAAVIAAGGCGKPAAPGTIPFDLHADSLGVEPMPENAKLAANLDKAQQEIERQSARFQPLPVVYFTEILALGLGLPEAETGLGEYYVDPRPILQDKGLLSGD